MGIIPTDNLGKTKESGLNFRAFSTSEEKRIASWKAYEFDRQVKAMLTRILGFSQDEYPYISDDEDEDCRYEDDECPDWTEVPECEEGGRLIVIDASTIDPTNEEECRWDWESINDTMKAY